MSADEANPSHHLSANQFDTLVFDLIDAMGRLREVQKKSPTADIRLHAAYAEGRIRYVATQLADLGVDSKAQLDRMKPSAP